MIDQTCLYRYPHQQEVVFDNGSKFKWDFNNLLKYFAIIPICTSINNPYINPPVGAYTPNDPQNDCYHGPW